MNGPCYSESDLRASGTVSVHHAGDLGDIVYSLLFASTLGEGRFLDVFLGPDPRFQVREPMTQAKCAWLAPLLERQPFVRSVTFAPAPPPVDYRLSEFRKSWFAPGSFCGPGKQIAACFFKHFAPGVKIPEKPWMVADPMPSDQHPIVINRTARWHGVGFPWREVISAYRGRMLFVGFKSEYDAWAKEFSAMAEFRATPDALELASLIMGAKLFIGNQSLPMAIALALGVPLIQESSPATPDCIFQRANAQFILNPATKLSLPALPIVKRVTTYPNRQGFYELGPFENAGGMGDTLMLTPLAGALGNKAVMCLPPAMEKYSFFFKGLCPVKIQENPPAIPFQPGLQSAMLLKRFGLPGVDPVPRIHLSMESLNEARKYLEGIINPVAFCPTCSRVWAMRRQRPPRYWEPVIAKLRERYSVLQFGLTDYPLVDGAKRMPFLSVEILAAVYQLIGIYVGTHTGDYHLMVAVGGKAAVADPDPWPEWACWTYDLPRRVQYGKLSHPKTMLDALGRLNI